MYASSSWARHCAEACMKLALDRPVHEFTDDGLKTWISRITYIHPWPLYGHTKFSSAIEDVLLLSHGNRVIPF